VATSEFLVPLVVAFAAYYIAGKLGQATTNIRSSNLGPVWPAFGIALAVVLGYGVRVWPAIAASAFVVALQSPVPVLTAAGQAAGATLAVVTGAIVLRGTRGFDPALARLRGALAFIVVAFAGALISASIGVYSLYETGVQAYTGIGSAWLIYWLGDATGALLVTPLVFTFPTPLRLQTNRRVGEFIVLLALLIAACFLVFGDLFPIRPHVLAFAVLPFVMWAAINFGVGGASFSVLVIATMATLLTAFGKGPFAQSTPFVNAALLDVLFMVLSVTGITLASLVSEREHAMTEREKLIREQAAMEALSSVNHRLIEAQEVERRRMARELHDDIGQRLAQLAVNISGITDTDPSAPPVQRRRAELEQQVSEIAADVQALSHRLHSSRLELLGITAAMRHFCAEFAAQHKVTIDVAFEDVPSEIASGVSLCLFRVLQEGLHNAMKYSGVRRFEVQLRRGNGQLHLFVRDPGTGFDVAAARRGQGLGLLSMEERIQMVNGQIVIESKPGRGTSIHARVPIGG
jgi:signal transduction histidine kinase